MWATMSAARIAAALGGKCTRNMVIGKAHRLGLATPSNRTGAARAVYALACGRREDWRPS
jgi:hypothetical protein